MFPLDEEILRAYFRKEEYQRQRMWMARLLHPETLKWAKGKPPEITETKRIRIEEMAKIGFDEAYYQRMVRGEEKATKEFTELVKGHPLWPHFEGIKGFGLVLAGDFIAAGGDISRAPTHSAFWAGMGLDLLPNGTVPRRIRGKKDVERRLPALPHVTRVGQQIRDSINRSDGRLKDFYRRFRDEVDAKNPGRAKIFNHKGALRLTQKILYACLWREWRLAYGLPAPEPYAFSILKHDSGGMITIEDFYEPAVTGTRKQGRARSKQAVPV